MLVAGDKFKCTFPGACFKQLDVLCAIQFGCCWLKINNKPLAPTTDKQKEVLDNNK